MLQPLWKIKRAACLRSAQAAELQALLRMLKEEPKGNDLALYTVSDQIDQALTIWLPAWNKDDLQTQNWNLVA